MEMRIHQVVMSAFGKHYQVKTWRNHKILVPPYQVLLLRLRKNPLGLESNESKLVVNASPIEVAMIDKRLKIEDEHIWGIPKNYREVCRLQDELHEGWLKCQVDKRTAGMLSAGEWSYQRREMFIYWLLWNGFMPGRGMRIVPENPAKRTSPANAVLLYANGKPVDKVPCLPQKFDNGEWWAGRDGAKTAYVKEWGAKIQRRNKMLKQHRRDYRAGLVG